MSNKEKFEEWFQQQPFYLNLRFIHGDRIFASENSVYRVLAVHIAWMTWMEQQKRVDELQKRIDVVTKYLESDLKYVENDYRGNFEFLQMAMIRCLKDDIKALRGEE